MMPDHRCSMSVTAAGPDGHSGSARLRTVGSRTDSLALFARYVALVYHSDFVLALNDDIVALRSFALGISGSLSMLKEAVASKAAKLLMTCVCPVAGTTALSLGVPQVRDAVHKATQPRQYAKPKTRIRAVPEEGVQVASAETPCPTVTPFALSDLPPVSPVPMESTPLQVAEAPPPDVAVPLTPRIFVPPGGGGSPPPMTGVPEPSTWVQLMLGFGLIGGVARVSYRKNGASAQGEAEKA